MPTLCAVRSRHMLRGLKAGRAGRSALGAAPPPAAGGVAAGGAAWATCGVSVNPPSKATADVSQARLPAAAMAVETARIFIRVDILTAPERLGINSPCLSLRSRFPKRARD